RKEECVLACKRGRVAGNLEDGPICLDICDPSPVADGAGNSLVVDQVSLKDDSEWGVALTCDRVRGRALAVHLPVERIAVRAYLQSSAIAAARSCRRRESSRPHSPDSA